MARREAHEQSSASKLRKEPLVESAYKMIRKQILEGGLQPGEQLVERRLADELGISRSPIRLALSRLQQEGLVNSHPYLGAFVESLSPTDVVEVYDLREVVEGLAARLLARRITQSQAAILQELADKADDPSSTLGDDEEFHSAIIHMCGSPKVNEMVRTFGLRVLTYDEATHRLASRDSVRQFGAGKSAVAHKLIAQEIASGEGAESEKAVRQHIRHGKNVMARLLLGIED